MDTVKKPLKSISTVLLAARRRELTDSLPPLDQVIRGSLITRYVKCGKSNCRCASGQGHPSLYLSSLHEGKTRLIYVPTSWEPWVQQRLDNFHRTQDILVELAEINLELLQRRVQD
ncbi:hypothetical protein JCM17380_14440 [Desulfosporosinus burensis]